MAGEQQRDDLVEQVLVGERLVALVARGDQQREDVVVALRVGPVGGDLLVEQAVDLRTHALGAMPPSQRGLQELGEQPHRPHVQDAELEQLGQHRAQPRQPGVVADADDGA